MCEISTLPSVEGHGAQCKLTDVSKELAEAIYRDGSAGKALASQPDNLSWILRTHKKVRESQLGELSAGLLLGNFYYFLGI